MSRNSRITQFKYQVKKMWEDKYISFLEKYLSVIPDGYSKVIAMCEVPLSFIEKLIETKKDEQIEGFWNYVSMNVNITEDFIEKYIDKPINWNNITDFQNISIKFFEKHLDKPWNFSFVQEIKGFTLDIFLKYPNIQWDWIRISRNSKTSLDFIESHLELPWEWGFNGISSNPNLTMDFVNKYLKLGYDYHFDFNSVFKNIKNKVIDKLLKSSKQHLALNTEYEKLLELLNIYEHKFDMDFVSRTAYINQEILDKYPNIWWNWEILPENIDITADIIENNIERIFQYVEQFDDGEDLYYAKKYISEIIQKNPNITLDCIDKILKKNIGFITSYETLSTKINVKISDIFDIDNLYDKISGINYEGTRYYMLGKIYRKAYNPILTQSPKVIIYNPNLTLNDILERSGLGWNWTIVANRFYISIDNMKKLNLTPQIISKNEHYPLEEIDKHNELDWDWYWIFKNNQTITIDFIEKYIGKIRLNKQIEIINTLITKPFYEHDQNKFILEQYKKYIMAYRIQQHYFKAITDPNYQMARKKINNDYDKLFKVCKL